jgi:hypothetical protein
MYECVAHIYIYIYIYYHVTFLGFFLYLMLCVCFYVPERVPVVLFIVAVLSGRSGRSEPLAISAVVYVLGVWSCDVWLWDGTVWVSRKGLFLRALVFFIRSSTGVV